MADQTKIQSVTQADVGFPPTEYSTGWTSRFANAVNLVLRRTANWLDDHVNPAGDPNPHDQYLLETVAIETFVYAAYGGMASSGTANTGIGSGWDTLQCDTVKPAPLHIGVNLVNNSLSWPVKSLNALSIGIVLTHNENNGSREFYLRSYNVTKGEVVGTEMPVGIARNQSATTFAIVVPLDIIAGYEDDELIFQVRSDDSINVITWDAIRIWSWNVGQYLGDIETVTPTQTGTAAFSDGFSEGFI